MKLIHKCGTVLNIPKPASQNFMKINHTIRAIQIITHLLLQPTFGYLLASFIPEALIEGLLCSNNSMTN